MLRDPAHGDAQKQKEEKLWHLDRLKFGSKLNVGTCGVDRVLNKTFLSFKGGAQHMDRRKCVKFALPRRLNAPLAKDLPLPPSHWTESTFVSVSKDNLP